MDKLQEIIFDFNRGRMKIENMKWLISTVEHQKEIIRDLKNKNRFKLFLEIATENLELREKIQTLEIERDNYKQAFEGMYKAK